MKKMYLALLLCVPSILLFACNDKKNSTEDNKVQQPAVETAKQDVASEKGQEKTDEVEASTTENAEKADEPGGIAKIKKVWKQRSFKVNAGKKAGIHDFALAFSKQFPEFEPNRVLGRFVTSPKDFSDYYEGAYQISDLSTLTFTYHLKDSPKQGYMRCEAGIQMDFRTDCCYWNRKNGHKLFAVFMVESYEDESLNDQLIVFFDYDPKTDTLKPEPQLTNMVEKQMEPSESWYDFWTVSLPEEGKDIQLYGNQNLEGDEGHYLEEEYFLMKWDGNSFTIEEQEYEEGDCTCDH